MSDATPDRQSFEPGDLVVHPEHGHGTIGLMIGDEYVALNPESGQ